MPVSFSEAEIRDRRRRFRRLMQEEDLDAFLLTDAENVRYLTGFTGDESWLLMPRAGRPKLITDFRFVAEAEDSTDTDVVTSEAGANNADAAEDKSTKAKPDTDDVAETADN